MIFSDPPGAVNQPKVDKIEKDGVTLAWDKPFNDGGAPITGYVIEKAGPDGKWEEVTLKPVQGNTHKVPCKKGEEAKFRVRAVNQEGPGEPSNPTALVKAENQPGRAQMPFLHRRKH